MHTYVYSLIIIKVVVIYKPKVAPPLKGMANATSTLSALADAHDALYCIGHVHISC